MRPGLVAVVIAALMALMFSPSSAQETCEVIDTSMEEVLPGVTLTWDSSFLCANAPDAGIYSFTVTIANHTSSVEAVTIDSLVLTHTTPRPRGQAPDATGEAGGLPLTVEPGQIQSFDLSGAYELVQTDEGKKANLHFQAYGRDIENGEPFSLGINAHFRAPGASDGGDEEPGGPPPGAGGPPPWAGHQGQHHAAHKWLLQLDWMKDIHCR